MFPAVRAGVTLNDDEPFDIALDADRFRHAGQSLAAQVAQERVNRRRPGRAGSGDDTVLDQDRAQSVFIMVGRSH